MKVGDTFKLQPIAVSSVGSDGSYGIDLSDLASLVPYSGRHGLLNAEVLDDSGATTPVGVGISLTLDTQGRPSNIAAINGDTKLSPALVTSDAGSAAASPSPAVAQTGSNLMPKFCNSTLTADLGARLAAVGQRYTTSTAVADTDFQYSRGASTTFGLGYSRSGSYGTFSSSGSYAASSTVTIDFPTRNVSTIDRTYFDAKKYHIVCQANTGGNPVTDNHYEVRSTFAGGTSSVNTGVPSYGWCIQYQAGSKLTKNTSTAVTWSNGFNTGPVIGLDLSVETGYTSSAQVVFAMKKTGSLCGTSGYAVNSPSQIVAVG